MIKLSKKLFLFLALFGSIHTLLGQKNTKLFDPKGLKVQWELTENEYLGKRQYLSAFTLTNTGKTVLPSANWTLYFNYIRDIDPSSVTGGVHIEAVNGDIFRLYPSNSFKALKPNESLTISFVSSELFVNVSDVPFGMYFVDNANPAAAQSITNYSIKPPKEDKVGYTTADKVFAKNELIKDIPLGQLPPIFPTPQSYQWQAGQFVLSQNTQILAQKEFLNEATLLGADIEKIVGKKPEIVSEVNGSAIVFRKDNSPEGAYALHISNEGIEIVASSGVGAFYAVQSLKCLFPWQATDKATTTITIPAIKVKDAPRFGFRSLMLDVARNFQTPQEVKKILSLMATYKLNVLHLHFIDDEGWRLEIPDLPELTAIGAMRGHTLDSKKYLPASFGAGPVAGATSASGFYTRQEFIDLLRYAAERHIQIIPEVESPGHARASIKAMDARYEKYMALGNPTEAERYLLKDPNDQSEYRTAQLWRDNVMCVGRPSVYEFAEKIVNEIVLMYQEAQAPLTTVHFGGDEVPAGVWEKSPICQELIKNTPSLKNTDDLWYYYFGKVNAILKAKGLFLSGWEEIAMRKTVLDGNKTMIPNPVLANENFQVNVWNNMIGWGAEDLPYRLANAGYRVILSCVSNMYFDLSYQKTFEEPGYYWGGFVDMDKPFYFIPYDYYKNSTEDRRGNPIAPSYFLGKDRLTDYGKSNIVGIQGLLWSESIKTPERLEYMLLPKLFGLAERAWAADPDWANASDATKYKELYDQAWSTFVNVVSKKELPRLDTFEGGYLYRIPTAGATIQNGQVLANVQFKGFTIRYTTDGSEPTAQSKIYQNPITEKGVITLKVFNSKGRAGRSIQVQNK